MYLELTAEVSTGVAASLGAEMAHREEAITEAVTRETTIETAVIKEAMTEVTKEETIIALGTPTTEIGAITEDRKAGTAKAASWASRSGTYEQRRWQKSELNDERDAIQNNASATSKHIQKMNTTKCQHFVWLILILYSDGNTTL